MSYEAYCVISNRTPLNIVVNCIAHKQREHMNLKQTLELVIMEWQGAWNHSTKGEWINRKHGEVNYYLTQMISGHRCFPAYLFKYKHVNTPYCLHCPGHIEDAEHILTQCCRFDFMRRTNDIFCKNSIKFMLESKKKWETVANVMADRLKILEWEDQIVRERIRNS